MQRAAVLFYSALAACAGGAPPSAPSSAVAGPPAAMEATRTGADDVIVARVQGRPVWGSCVATQAEHGLTRAAALEQCIDFELMAQAAEQRGLFRDPEVVTATRTAMVSQLVGHAYEDAFAHKQDFGPAWDGLVAAHKLAFQYRHEEYRASVYARITVADGATPAEDAAAHALADQIAAAAAGETGLTGMGLSDLAHRIAGPRKVDVALTPLYKIGGLEDHYGDALFAIPAVGRSSPATRTKWGWDVIVWTEVEPARHPSDAELEQELLPVVKRAYFPTWVNQLAKQLGLHVELVKANVDRLEDE